MIGNKLQSVLHGRDQNILTLLCQATWKNSHNSQPYLSMQNVLKSLYLVLLKQGEIEHLIHHFDKIINDIFY